MGSKRYPTEIRAQAVDLYRAGLSTSEISSLTGAKKCSLWKWAKSAGIQLKSTSPYPDEIRSQAIAMYEQGITFEDIAAKLGVSSGSLWHWAKAAGIPIRRSLHPTALRLKCQRDYERGLGASSLAEKYHLPVSTCENWVSEWKRLTQQAAKLVFPQHTADRPFQRIREQPGINRAIWR